MKFHQKFRLVFLLAGTGMTAMAQEGSMLKLEPATNSNSKAQSSKPYLIIICGDGFRYDYAAKYEAENLLTLSSKGIRAERMIPSYPSVTHPNHFTLLSGLYPGHTGIVGNNFYDPERKAFFKSDDGAWFKEEPVWATAEKQQMLTANFRWVDADAANKGISTSYAFHPSPKNGTDGEQAAVFVKELLSMPEAKRPHLILMYFGDTDHAGHVFGPESDKTREAVHKIDDALGRINAEAQKSGLPVNIIFVSDHGMANIDQNHPIHIPTVIDTAKFVVNNQNPLVNIYAKDRSAISSTYQELKNEHAVDYDVYLNGEVPAEFHYGGKDDRYHRVGDIVLIARFPKTFNPKPGAGAHGYNPFTVKEMGATFAAWGPAFKAHLGVKEFKNIEVYDVITSVLQIKGNLNDGNGSLANKILN